MEKKVLHLLGSVRVWIIALTAMLAVLNGNPMVETIQAALMAIVALGSADSVATKFGGK